MKTVDNWEYLPQLIHFHPIYKISIPLINPILFLFLIFYYRKTPYFHPFSASYFTTHLPLKKPTISTFLNRPSFTIALTNPLLSLHFWTFINSKITKMTLLITLYPYSHKGSSDTHPVNFHINSLYPLV